MSGFASSLSLRITELKINWYKVEKYVNQGNTYLVYPHVTIEIVCKTTQVPQADASIEHSRDRFRFQDLLTMKNYKWKINDKYEQNVNQGNTLFVTHYYNIIWKPRKSHTLTQALIILATDVRVCYILTMKDITLKKQLMKWTNCEPRKLIVKTHVNINLYVN